MCSATKSGAGATICRTQKLVWCPVFLTMDFYGLLTVCIYHVKGPYENLPLWF